jgi:UPF0042 nucleotide-binding protein
MSTTDVPMVREGAVTRPCTRTRGTRRAVVVTGLSGGGKASILRVLEDLGYEAVDNPPLHLMEDMAARADRPIAIGVDVRSRGFDASVLLGVLSRLRLNTDLRPELVFAWADEASLLRRFTETRRRHPLAATGRLTDGVAAEVALTADLRSAADLLLDTSDLPLPMLRRMIEQRFGIAANDEDGMTCSLISFAYPAGLPREADLVFDTRFLRNPHYVPILRDRTGLDPDVAAYVEADQDFRPFMTKVTELLTMLLPRFVQEGKKYVAIGVGCTGGQHRSVHVVQTLADRLTDLRSTLPSGAPGWRITVTHRELARPASAAAQRAGTGAGVTAGGTIFDGGSTLLPQAKEA